MQRDPDPIPTCRQKLLELRQMTWMIYVLYALAPLTGGVSAVVSLLINRSLRLQAQGTTFESHLRWQGQMFWGGLAWLVLGYLTVWWHYLGLAVFSAGLAWYVYRLIKGFSYLSLGQPLPPTTPTQLFPPKLIEPP